MLSFLKYLSLFAIFFLLLSIPIRQRALFYHIEKHTSPVILKGFSELKYFVKSRGSQIKDIENEPLLGNELETEAGMVEDSISTEGSAIKKEKEQGKKNPSLKKEKDSYEEYNNLDKERLENVLKYN